MGVEYRIDVSGLEEALKKLGDLQKPDTMIRMNKEIGFACAELTADHIASKVSPTHHKTADRLGAAHTGFFEFARGRQGFYQGKDHKGDQGTGYIESKDVQPDGVKVVIGNTPGMSRAFRALDIKPKRAKELTIPIHRESYGLSVREFKAMNGGVRLFRVQTKRNTALLFGTEGSGAHRRTRPLYCLVKDAHIPQDRGLLPTMEEYRDKAVETAEAFIEVESL